MPTDADHLAPAVELDLPLVPTSWPIDRRGRRAFWLAYWFRFFQFLPWMLLRQLAITVRDWWWAWRTTGRSWRFLDDRLAIGFVGGGELLVTAGMFGERFTWLRWHDVLIDPGPARCRAVVMAALVPGIPPTVVVCTHWHEEHIGNAAAAAERWGIPVVGAPLTCEALCSPPVLPAGRALLMGAVAAASSSRVMPIGHEVRTALTTLEVIAADGHCRDHVVLFDRQAGVLFAGDAFLHELFTSPNADADHRAWIATLDRLAELPVRTMVGAHGPIISCDPAIPPIAGVVQHGDPRQLIAAKRRFLGWARSVVTAGEPAGVPYSVIEATIFPWERSWSWRTWFHDEGFRLLTCGEFSRTHLVRSLADRPQQVPVRFPALLRIAGPLAAIGPELLRIHLLALRPEPVLTIAGSILVSGAVLAVAAGIVDQPQVLAMAAPRLVQDAAWSRLFWVFGIWTVWWSVIGGAITRRMALAIAGTDGESWVASLRWCVRPGLLLPSAMASWCLFLIALAGAWPLLVLAVPPIWLTAGVLYAGLCLPPGTTRGALADLFAIVQRPWPYLRRQLVFLVGFLVSTGIVYAAAGSWAWAIASLLGWSWPAFVLIVPVAVYATGYTTANLKSLQIWLWLRRNDP